MDQRLEKLAQVLVSYSAAVQTGDIVRIFGPVTARELATSVYRHVIRAGAHPQIVLTPDECKEILLVEGSEDQLRFADPIKQFEIETIDVLISLWAQDNTKALSQIDPAKQSLMSQGRKKYLETYLGRAADGTLRWVGTQAPCHAAAQDAEMSLSAYEEFVLNAGMIHLDDPVAAWRELSRQQQRLVDFLNSKSEIRFVTPTGTDLRLGIAGRTWINCDGHENFPDGEVFTGPIEDATQGTVCYSFPAVHGGREVDGIRLEFRDGKVTSATAQKGEPFLHAMLEQDEGAKTLGEIAVGTNYAIDRYTKNTLFDEKIGGTFHAALGAAYPESGGVNQSCLHWDMVCDLRKGGQIFVDGELISENGRFTNSNWPQPE